MKWEGVFPAITTPFDERLAVDEAALARHVTRMVDAGCTGIVPFGSLGEGNTLSFDEKLRAIDVVRQALGDRAPVVPGIAALSTADAATLAAAAEAHGCDGLMLLPPYVYRGDARETLAYFDAVLGATTLPCMLYNNPIAYGTDVSPIEVAVLAERHSNLAAIKESSADIRRVTALRRLVANRLAIFVGVDDLIVEGIGAGATGWIAGLVNAFPRESVELFDLCKRGAFEAAAQLYEWFLPLLRLDTIPKFVQAIKLVQSETGGGSEQVRPPRLPLEGNEREEVLQIVRTALRTRPAIPA